MNDSLDKIRAGRVNPSNRDGIEPVHPKDFEGLKKSQDIIIFVLLVMVASAFFALGAIWIDYLAEKKATYQDLRDKVEEQNRLINKTLENQVYIEESIGDLSTKVGTST